MNRYLKGLLVASVLSASSVTVQAQAVLRAAPSGRATAEVTLSYPQVAGAAAATPAPKPIVIKLDYGQPHLRGRALHTDSLVPYDKPWRLGANGSTMLTTDVDLMLGSAMLAKGTYVLYVIPSRATWKLVVQKSVGQQPGTYKDADDVARVDLKHTALPIAVEGLTMWLIPATGAGPARGELRFAWGTDLLTTTWMVH